MNNFQNSFPILNKSQALYIKKISYFVVTRGIFVYVFFFFFFFFFFCTSLYVCVTLPEVKQLKMGEKEGFFLKFIFFRFLDAEFFHWHRFSF